MNPIIPNFKAPELIETWPHAIATYFFDRDITEEEKNLALELCKDLKNNEGNAHTTDIRVLDNPGFKEIKEFCLKCVKSYLTFVLDPLPGVEPYITISWINVTEQGQSHHRHSHPNSLLSGVFYLNANQEEDSIIFLRPVYKRILYHRLNTTKYNSDSCKLPVHSGNLVLFDSEIEHTVFPTTGDHARLSLSFNVFVKGIVGEEQSLTYLDLKGE